MDNHHGTVTTHCVDGGALGIVQGHSCKGGVYLIWVRGNESNPLDFFRIWKPNVVNESRSTQIRFSRQQHIDKLILSPFWIRRILTSLDFNLTDGTNGWKASFSVDNRFLSFRGLRVCDMMLTVRTSEDYPTLFWELESENQNPKKNLGGSYTPRCLVESSFCSENYRPQIYLFCSDLRWRIRSKFLLVDVYQEVQTEKPNLIGTGVAAVRQMWE